MMIFLGFLPIREPFVCAFNETRAVTSQKDLVKLGMKILKV